MSQKVKRTFKHWTPRYAVNRARLMVYEAQHPDHPWITGASIEILASLLRPDDVGLELGSGRSTLWLAHRVGRLISLEHHAGWHERMSRMLVEQHLTNVEYNRLSLGDPYVDFVLALPDVTFDFILVDGPERDRCAAACTSKLKPGGVLILDNANLYLPCASKAPWSLHLGDAFLTPYWARFAESVQSWRHIWTTNGVSDTVIWIKPV
jgi:predicted O-methyltransferase YrrM